MVATKRESTFVLGYVTTHFELQCVVPLIRASLLRLVVRGCGISKQQCVSEIPFPSGLVRIWPALRPSPRMKIHPWNKDPWFWGFTSLWGRTGHRFLVFSDEKILCIVLALRSLSVSSTALIAPCVADKYIINSSPGRGATSVGSAAICCLSCVKASSAVVVQRKSPFFVHFLSVLNKGSDLSADLDSFFAGCSSDICSLHFSFKSLFACFPSHLPFFSESIGIKSLIGSLIGVTDRHLESAISSKKGCVVSFIENIVALQTIEEDQHHEVQPVTLESAVFVMFSSLNWWIRGSSYLKGKQHLVLSMFMKLYPSQGVVFASKEPEHKQLAAATFILLLVEEIAQLLVSCIAKKLVLCQDIESIEVDLLSWLLSLSIVHYRKSFQFPPKGESLGDH
ncbi:hypothetical protein Tco_0409842 [Tanacetum coccineum]